MNVLHVASSLSRLGGGVPAVVWALAIQQQRMGLRSAVLGTHDAHTREDLPAGACSYHAFSGRIGSGAVSQQAQQLLGEAQLVHRHGLWVRLGRKAQAWARQTGTPVVLSPHGMLDTYALTQSAWKKRIAAAFFERRHLREVACFHALCEPELRDIRRFGLSNPVAIIPNGIDLETVGPLPDRDEALTRWPQLVGKKLMLYLGRISPKKGLLKLLPAWARAGEALDDWRLVIAGPDKRGHLLEVRSCAEDNRLTDSVTFTGPAYQQDKRDLLALADAFVLPSFSEGFTIAVLEAMACGLPIILTPQCNFDQVAEVGAGLLARPEVDELAEALAQMAQMSDAQRAEMGGKGLALVREEYTWQRVTEQMVELYRWLVGEAGRPACVQLD